MIHGFWIRLELGQITAARGRDSRSTLPCWSGNLKMKLGLCWELSWLG